VHLEPESTELSTDPSSALSGDPISPAVTPGDRRYRVGGRWLVASGAIALFGIGGWAGYQRFFQPAPTSVTARLISVKRGMVERTSSESGVVQLAGQQVLKSPEDVTVEQVFVEAGDRVKAGAPLIALRNREAQREQQNQRVENRKAMLDLTRRREIVQERRAKLTHAEQRLKESQELLRQGFIPETEVQGDRDKVDDARSELKNAEVEQHKAELDQQKGQAALREIQNRLGDNRLNSPMDALILQVDVKPGDGAKREASLLTLGDPSRENVSLQLTTLNASQVRINQVARISMIGPNPKTFLGRVVSLSPQAASPKSESSWGSQPQAKVDAVVALDRPSRVLIPGSAVSVEIVLNQRRNVLSLPLDAVQQAEDTPFVWIKNTAGKAEKRPVKLGLQSLTMAEILSGLKDGDTVAIPPPNQSLTSGAALQAGDVSVDSPVPSP